MERGDHKIALIGFGEAASAFAEGWRRDASALVAAFDAKTLVDDTNVSAAKWADYERAGVTGYRTTAAALTEALLAFSLVTPDQALQAAEQAAPAVGAGTLYLDCNSSSPATKRRASEAIEAAGGRYVDVAIMAPVHPLLHQTPLLVSGPHSEEALAAISGLGMKGRQVSQTIGDASSVKMVRSIVVKGLEALVLECVVAGERAGVAEAVLGSLDESYPEFNWHRRASYMLERMTKHGTRRAAELSEVAETLTELDVDAWMTNAAADWQRRIGALKIDPSSRKSGLAKLISSLLSEEPASDTKAA